MDFFGFLWISMYFYGFQRISKDFSLDLYGFLWISMDFFRFLVGSMDLYGFPWIFHGLERNQGILIFTGHPPKRTEK